MIILHREIGGTAVLIVQPDLLIMVEPQPNDRPGAVITTYSGEKIAVRETLQHIQNLLMEDAQQRR